MSGWSPLVFGMLLVAALIGGMIVYTNAIVDHERRCEALGGWVQNVPRGIGICVRDGLIVRVSGQ